MRSRIGRWSAVVATVVFLLSAAAAFANHPVRVTLNEQEIKTEIPSTIINDRTMVPIRSVAAIFDCAVEWDADSKTVHITDPGRISKQYVSQLIQEQGKETDYYFDGLYFELVNIDRDTDLEILARIDGGANLGNFFVFDRIADGRYKLIKEEAWKVWSWNTGAGMQIGWNPVHELITKTGGTGVGIVTAHLWSVDDGRYVELWQGAVEEWSTFQDQLHKMMGGYRVSGDDLSICRWQTSQQYRFEGDGTVPVSAPETVMTKYELVDGRYVLSSVEDIEEGAGTP